jgi:hypothetical protein
MKMLVIATADTKMVWRDWCKCIQAGRGRAALEADPRVISMEGMTRGEFMAAAEPLLADIPPLERFEATTC